MIKSTFHSYQIMKATKKDYIQDLFVHVSNNKMALISTTAIQKHHILFWVQNPQHLHKYRKSSKSFQQRVFPLFLSLPQLSHISSPKYCYKCKVPFCSNKAYYSQSKPTFLCKSILIHLMFSVAFLRNQDSSCVLLLCYMFLKFFLLCYVFFYYVIPSHKQLYTKTNTLLEFYEKI